MLPDLFVCAALAVAPAAKAAPAPEPAPLAAPAPEAAPAAATCAVRDPEDGRCYPSADAADVAWLSRGTTAPAVRAAALAALEPPAPADDEELSDDEDEGEDGGALAPVDATLRPGARLPALSELQRAAQGRTEASGGLGGLLAKVKGLVVRRADSKPVSIPEEEIAGLFDADFPLPLEAFVTAKFRDSFLASRGRHRKHHAIDLPAPKGTPVVAVVDGTIERIGRDRRGGNVVYLRDASGRFTFFYAHLQKFEKTLRIGDKVTRGQRLGFVGTTGHVIGGAHLHFAIFREAEDSNWKAFAVNPYVVFSTFFRR